MFDREASLQLLLWRLHGVCVWIDAGVCGCV